MIHYLTIGVLFGLSGGLAPGPLLTLVISETILHDIRAGIKVAVAPLITDLPIVMLTIFISSRFSGSDLFVGGISLVGGVVVLLMGVSGLKTGGVEIEITKSQPKSLSKGILANALNPHPYLFWMSVGTPKMTQAYEQHFSYATVFVVSLYILLVGSKVVLALLVGKSKSYLKGRVYIYTMRFLGMALCVFSFFFFKEGLHLLKIY